MRVEVSVEVNTSTLCSIHRTHVLPPQTVLGIFVPCYLREEKRGDDEGRRGEERKGGEEEGGREGRGGGREGEGRKGRRKEGRRGRGQGGAASDIIMSGQQHCSSSTYIVTIRVGYWNHHYLDILQQTCKL